MTTYEKVWAYGIVPSAMFGILVWAYNQKVTQENALIAKKKEAAMFQHETDCYDLQTCLESSLSYSKDSDVCYPITPIWGWPGEKTEDLLSACKLFKKIRSVNEQ